MNNIKTFTVEGENYLEKIVSKQSDVTGKIYLPGAWIGRMVAVILLPGKDEGKALSLSSAVNSTIIEADPEQKEGHTDTGNTVLY